MTSGWDRLSADQRQGCERWFPGAELVADLSWGLVDTAVLQLRHGAGGTINDIVLKAAGPGNGHIPREIRGHREFTSPWLREGRVGRLLQADRELSMLALTHLPGVLVEGTAAAHAAEVHRQAGELLAALHGQASRISDDFEVRADERTLRWLDTPHRISRDIEDQLRAAIAAHDHPPAVLVPTHGDWHTRNWLIDAGTVKVIDLGRADWRPAITDLTRLAAREWKGRLDLEQAFVDGYGEDPREPAEWQRTRLREAIGTAVWAYQVGDEPFEQQGHRMIDEALAGS